MEIFSKQRIYDFMGKSTLFFSISMILVIASFVILATRGLNYGIDFAGGTLVQVKYDKKAPINEIRDILTKEVMFKDAIITEFGSPEEIVIKFTTSNDNVGINIGDRISELLKDTGKFEIRRVDVVGPKVGGELREKGLMALFLSLIVTLVYLAFRFEWRFGVASILALVHDVSIVLGAICLFRIDVNLDILAALLTLIGYSLNDTIIIFDRVREQVTKSKENELSAVINESVSLTLPRTILTSLTVFFVVFTLFEFGGEIIYGFSFSLLIGVVVGSYSSIFIAAPTLRWMGFNVMDYRAKEAAKEKRRIEKEKMRSMYERGIV